MLYENADRADDDNYDRSRCALSMVKFCALRQQFEKKMDEKSVVIKIMRFF